MKQKPKKPVKSLAKPVLKEQPFNYKYLLLGVILLTAILYSNNLHNEMVNFDDVEYFTKYPEITNLTWASLGKFFSSYYVLMYQPLPVLTFALNYYFSGTDTMPIHLLNIVMHLADIALVYYFIKQLCHKDNIAFIVALLFALHPMNVEAVTWISARSSSMYTFFYLLALLSYIKYIRSDYKLKYILYTGLFFILSLFSKSQAVTLPVLLFAIDYFLQRKFSWKTVTEKIPFFALSIVFGIITLMNTGTQTNLTEGMLTNYTAPDIFFMFCYSFTFYIYKLFLPFNLCAFYTFPNPANLPWLYYASPVLLLLMIYILYRHRQNRWVLFGAALFLITISINIQVIPSRLVIVADRYTYFPYIGLFFIIGYCYDLIAAKQEDKKKLKNIFTGVLVFWSLCSCYEIWQRNTVWKNDLVFITDIINKNDPGPFIGKAYRNRGDYYIRNDMIPEAIADFDEAARLAPKEGITYYNRAAAYLKIHKLPEALKDLDMSIKYQPDNAYAYSNRAFIRFNQQDITGALQDCDTCIARNDSIAEAYNIRSSIEYIQKDYDACEKDLDKTIALNPDMPDVYKNRGLLYFMTNRQQQACKDWEKAAALGNQAAVGLLKENCR